MRPTNAAIFAAACLAAGCIFSGGVEHPPSPADTGNNGTADATIDSAGDADGNNSDDLGSPDVCPPECILTPDGCECFEGCTPPCIEQCADRGTACLSQQGSLCHCDEPPPDNNIVDPVCDPSDQNRGSEVCALSFACGDVPISTTCIYSCGETCGADFKCHGNLCADQKVFSSAALEFGAAVAIGEEYVVVGAPGGDVATVYDHSLQELAELSLPDNSPNARFGAAVVTVDEIVAVGAPNFGAGQGVVYIYQSLNADAPRAVHAIDIPGGSPVFAYQNARLGSSLAAAKRVDPDGSVTRVIFAGAPGANEVVILTQPAGESGWSVGRLPAHPNPPQGARIGAAVDASADGNRVVAGGPGVGSAFLYQLSGGFWNGPVEVKPPDSVSFPEFGTAIDLTPDGRTAVVGGNPGYVVLRETDTWRVIGEPVGGTGELGAAVAVTDQLVAVGNPAAAQGGAITFIAEAGGTPRPLHRRTGDDAGAVRLGASVAARENLFVIGAEGTALLWEVHP